MVILLERGGHVGLEVGHLLLVDARSFRRVDVSNAGQGWLLAVELPRGTVVHPSEKALKLVFEERIALL